MPTNCTHTRKVHGYWEEVKTIDYDGYPVIDSEWVDGYDVDTVVDISLHAYKCTQCGHVMYYSSNGKALHEAL